MPRWLKVAIAVYLAIGVLITVTMVKYPSPTIIAGVRIANEPRTWSEVVETLAENPLIVLTTVLIWPALL